MSAGHRAPLTYLCVAASSWEVSSLCILLPKTALAALAGLCPFPVTVFPSSPAYTYLKQHFQPLQIFHQKFWPCKSLPSREKLFLHRNRNLSPRRFNEPYAIGYSNRLAVPTLAEGFRVVVKPCNLRRSLLFKEIAILAVPRGPCLRNPLLMAIKVSLMFPAVPDRRFDATVPGPRRVIIKSGPTGGRRCPRYGTLLKRWSRVRSSWSRSGSFNGTPRPGVAREPEKPFQRRGDLFIFALRAPMHSKLFFIYIAHAVGYRPHIPH
jgi:hypothetical protein